MSMIPGVDDDRWSQGMAAERFHPWYGEELEPQPVATEHDGMAGLVAVLTVHGPQGGVTYEQTEPVNGRHHRGRSSGPKPNTVRPA
jgi:hypothetical protein